MKRIKRREKKETHPYEIREQITRNESVRVYGLKAANPIQ